MPETFSLLTPSGEPFLDVRIHGGAYTPHDLVGAIELRAAMAVVPSFIDELRQDPGISPDVVEGAVWLYNRLVSTLSEPVEVAATEPDGDVL